VAYEKGETYLPNPSARAAMFNIKILCFHHTRCLCIPYYYQKNDPLLPSKALTGLSFYWKKKKKTKKKKKKKKKELIYLQVFRNILAKHE
jgi:hypothetical protein